MALLAHVVVDESVFDSSAAAKQDELEGLVQNSAALTEVRIKSE